MMPGAGVVPADRGGGILRIFSWALLLVNLFGVSPGLAETAKWSFEFHPSDFVVKEDRLKKPLLVEKYSEKAEIGGNYPVESWQAGVGRSLRYKESF